MSTQLMFICESRPLSSAMVRLEDGRELQLDDAGLSSVELTPGVMSVEILIDDEWRSHTIEVDDDVKNSMLVVDVSKNKSQTGVGLAGHTLGGRYRIESALGHGGMGVVYRATDIRLKRDIAIKTLNEQLRSNEEARRLFLQEARQMAPLSHPHLVAVHDVTTVDGHDLMITELIEGEDLDSWRKAAGTLPIDDVLIVTYQLTVAVGFLHDQGMIHRDLKPANAILEDGGGVKLIDFGLARSMEHLLAKGTALRGTPAYMAPEQVLGPGLSSATDIYQLGVTFYELLTGALPVESSEGNILAQVKAARRSILSLRPELPKALAELIHACMSQEPADRPSADEVANKLVRLYHERTGEAPPSSVSTGAIVTGEIKAITDGAL